MSGKKSDITEVSIVTHHEDGSHARHVTRKDKTILCFRAWTSSNVFVIEVADDDVSSENYGLPVKSEQEITLSREEFKVLREHVNDPDTLRKFGL